MRVGRLCLNPTLHLAANPGGGVVGTKNNPFTGNDDGALRSSFRPSFLTVDRSACLDFRAQPGRCSSNWPMAARRRYAGRAALAAAATQKCAFWRSKIEKHLDAPTACLLQGASVTEGAETVHRLVFVRYITIVCMCSIVCMQVWAARLLVELQHAPDI